MNNSNNYFEEQRKFYDNQDAQKYQQNNPEEKMQNKSTKDNIPFGTAQNVNSQAQTFKKLADYYNKNGEDKLISDIFNTVKAQKANGTLTNEQLIKFAKSIYPMLNPTQREKIKELLNQLLET